MLYPTTGTGELVGASQLRSTSCATAVPTPLRVAVVLPPAELLLMVSCPLWVPAVVGSNCSCSVKVCVGFSVTGKLPPTIVKPAPVIVTEFIVTGDVPVDVRVNDCVVDVFTVTLPKLRVAVFIINCGFAVVPTPPKVTVVVLPVDELLPIVTCPVEGPASVGSNCTSNVTD